jgi:septum formation topological specificity factor MinE
MKKDIQDIEAAIAAINANMSQYATASKVTAEITALRTDLTTTLKAYIDQKIDDLTVQVNYNSADIAAVKAEIDSIEIALAALNTNLSKYATIQKVNDELAALRADLTAVLQSYVDQKKKDGHGGFLETGGLYDVCPELIDLNKWGEVDGTSTHRFDATDNLGIFSPFAWMADFPNSLSADYHAGLNERIARAMGQWKTELYAKAFALIREETVSLEYYEEWLKKQ